MKAVFKSKKNLEDARGSSNKEPRVEELVDLITSTPKKWMHIRMVGPVASYGMHWVPVSLKEAAEVKATQKGKAKRFPQVCLAFDPETEEVDSTKSCPWCDAENDAIQLSTDYFQNVIVRSIQENEPKKKGKMTKSEAKTGMKDGKDSECWTPVRVFRLNGGMIRDLKRLGALNRHKDKKTGESKVYSLSHEKYGKDVMVMYDPDEKTPSKRTTIQLGDKSPLTDEEQEYLVWNIENLMHPKKPNEAKREFESWAKRQEGLKKSKKSKDEDEDDDDDADDDSDDDEDDDDEDEKPKKGKGKGKPAKGKKGKSKSDDDLDDEDDLDDDEDEPKSKKGKGKASKGKKSKSDDDEDEDDDSDDDDDDSDSDEDDDEDDEPKKGKGKKSKPAKKGKKSKSDDEDEDDDDLDDDDLDDEDDDEDEKPSKKSKKSKSKKSKDEDEDDDDDIDDEDLDDDDDDDDDDEEEDEKPKKKGKSKTKSKPAKKGKAGKKKKKSDDDDD